MKKALCLTALLAAAACLLCACSLAEYLLPQRGTLPPTTAATEAPTEAPDSME